MNTLIKTIANIANKQKIKVYIVGGYLRDKILKRQTYDIDFVVFGNVEKFAKTVADKLNGSFINLSRKFGFYRVIINPLIFPLPFGKRIKVREIQLDFAKSKGKTLKSDLKLRDFTINTLLAKPKTPENIIDKLNAIKDINKKLIKETNNKIFRQDPLRILRAVRISANLQFNISSSVKKLIKKDCFLLNHISGERVRDELFKILENNDFLKHIKLMDKLKILEILFPEISAMKKIKQSGNHHLDVWNHSIETVRLLNYSIGKTEKLNNQLKNNIKKYLNEEITKSRKRLELIKLAALLHDIAKPEVRAVIDGRIKFLRHESLGANRMTKVGKYLKLSRNEIKFLKILIANHLRVGNLSSGKKVTKKAISRFVFDIKDDCFGVLILSLADRLAARGEMVTNKVISKHIEVTKKVLDAYQKSLITSNLPKLISGYDLIKKLGLKEGPIIGKILNKIREAQIDGKISTNTEALLLAKQLHGE